MDTSLLADVFVTVLVIMDPLGSTPIFLSLTREQTHAERKRSAMQAATVAAGVILLFALFGEQLLRSLGISLEALQVAGGLLLLVVALELFHGSDDDAMRATGANVALVPLGTPLLAGPGAIATAMVYMRRSQDWADKGTVLLGLIGVLIVVYLALRFATVIARVLKPNAIHLVSRILGLLVAAIGVQLVAKAIEQWVRHGV
ncbi:MAG: MarC family protein [Acidimicrobiales bacterium]|nr:MarC family protein [Acidimicrobiales bacterium]